MERPLAVTMPTDLVGFTRFMERDEVGTWFQMRALRKDVIGPAITRRDSVILKITGGGMLAELRFRRG